MLSLGRYQGVPGRKEVSKDTLVGFSRAGGEGNSGTGCGDKSGQGIPCIRDRPRGSLSRSVLTRGIAPGVAEGVGHRRRHF